MKLYLTEKKALKFLNNAESFLNGLTANHVASPRNAFVNIHGKIIAVYDQVLIDEEECLVVIEPQYLNPLMDHLEKFIKLSGVKVEVLEKNVYFDLDGGYPADESEYKVLQKAGELIITDKALEAGVTAEQFTLFRIQNNMPVQGIDFNDDFLLNVSMSELVSFTKGCFLGQEPISKVYNRSKLSWRLVVKSEDNCTEQEREKMTSRILNPDSGKVEGFVFESNK